jgi:hypothetical protein
MMVTVKKAVFWDVTPCGSCKNQRLRGKWCLYNQSDKHWSTRNNVSSNYQPKHSVKKYYVSVRRLIVTADVPSSPMFVTPMMDELSSSETSVLTRATQHSISEDGIIQLMYCFSVFPFFFLLYLTNAENMINVDQLHQNLY